jgi:hypothetical protein
VRTAKQFWDWFLAHEPEISAMEHRDDRLMDEIHAALCAYNEALGFELSDEHDGMRELIISAMSDPTVFDAVDQLVAEAPALSRWRFTALKPPRGFDFAFDGDSVHLEPKTMVFQPLRSETKPGVLGLRVYLPISNITPAIETAVRRVIEIGLGERASSQIEAIDTETLTGSPSDHIPLVDLSEYITSNPLSGSLVSAIPIDDRQSAINKQSRIEDHQSTIARPRCER